MTILKDTTPIARKEHRCEFCYGTIAVGQQYRRQTNIVDGEIGDFICHTECMEVARMLDMFDDCDPDYGLTDEMFRGAITNMFTITTMTMNLMTSPRIGPI